MRRLNNVTTTLYDLLYYFGIKLNVFNSLEIDGEMSKIHT